VEPANVSALGHLPLTVAGSGLSADVRYCIFGEDERAIEADGRCQSPPYAKFDYVEPWKITRIYPSEFDEKQQAEGFRLFISGENFLPAKTATCRLGGRILAPAEVIGTNYTLLCMVPPTGFQLEGSPGGRTYEVEVAINGQDFVGGTPPVLVRFVTATAIVTVEPANVSALGHLPLTVAGSGLSADVRYCIFGEDERAIEVPLASLASEREVVCITPHWEIRPYGAVSERVWFDLPLMVWARQGVLPLTSPLLLIHMPTL